MSKNLDNILFQRKKDLLSSRMDQETVMMHPESGKYFSLNPVATRIWELLITPHTLDDIVKILLDEFEVEPQICKNETKEFIEKLLEKDILEIKV
jgi:hypothetical protein